MDIATIIGVVEHHALSKDGLGLIAQINGYPTLVDSCLHVDPTYTLDGDVDFATGNVTCIGHLVITGDVKAGFNVKGAQNVTVFGVVDGGEIDAGGSVLLHGNLFGQHKSHVQCGESFRGTYVDAIGLQQNLDLVQEALKCRIIVDAWKDFNTCGNFVLTAQIV